MNKEQLIAQGLTEAQADAVLKLHKDSIDGTYVTKVAFEAEREKVKTLNTEVTNRDTQITDLGKFKGTADDLKIKVDKLEADNKTAKEAFDAQVAEINLKALITADIKDLVVDVDDVMSKLDLTKVVVKDNKIVSGLTDQTDLIKQSKPHYFKEAAAPGAATPKGWVFGKTPAEGVDGAQGKDNEFVTFGKQLAQAKVSGVTAATKAGDTYFK